MCRQFASCLHERLLQDRTQLLCPSTLSNVLKFFLIIQDHTFRSRARCSVQHNLSQPKPIGLSLSRQRVIPAAMPSKQSLETQSSSEKEIPKPFKDSGVATAALSAADMSSRVNPKVDVSPEDPKPLPNDVEVTPAESTLLSNGQCRSSMKVIHFK